jgi:hypothetical protein
METPDPTLVESLMPKMWTLMETPDPTLVESLMPKMWTLMEQVLTHLQLVQRLPQQQLPLCPSGCSSASLCSTER